MSVTRFGVSALKVVATIDSPASHHGTARPEAKNSEVLRPARSAKNSAGPKQISSEARTMSQSSVERCMGEAESMRSLPHLEREGDPSGPSGCGRAGRRDLPLLHQHHLHPPAAVGTLDIDVTIFFGTDHNELFSARQHAE